MSKVRWRTSRHDKNVKIPRPHTDQNDRIGSRQLGFYWMVVGLWELEKYRLLDLRSIHAMLFKSSNMRFAASKAQSLHKLVGKGLLVEVRDCGPMRNKSGYIPASVERGLSHHVGKHNEAMGNTITHQLFGKEKPKQELLVKAKHERSNTNTKRRHVGILDF